MNCRPGDLAIVVKGGPRINLGRVVRVTHLTRHPILAMLGIPAWHYEGKLIALTGGRAETVADDCLRPLRGDIKPEEITTTDDLPVRETA